MSISLYNLKRWAKMLAGKSIYHVDQGLGKAISKGGYYNDLTQKVLMGEKSLNEYGIPVLEHSDGHFVEMPTMIFQYGLGAYDLWVIEKQQDYLDKAIQCAQWAIDHQQKDGSWNVFSYIYPETPYSAMPQGEGTSLLLRIYQVTKEERWLIAARKATDYMLKDVQDGGVTQYKENNMILLEYTHLPIVLNGWIFAAFGLYDMALMDKNYQEAFSRTISTLKEWLPKFDNGFWSLYDASGLITSPFYHNLHIAQLQAMYIITHDLVFKEYQDKFQKYKSSWFNSKKAFLIKAVQKIREK